MAEIAKVVYSHDAIIDWLITNPDKDYGDCAIKFGYTRAWLSTIVNSDAFKAEYTRRRNELNSRLADGIMTKAAENALKALDRIGDILDDEETDPRLIVDAGDKLLHRLGYAPSRGVSVNLQQNNFNSPVQRDTLALAREAMSAITSTAVPMLESK